MTKNLKSLILICGVCFVIIYIYSTPETLASTNAIARAWEGRTTQVKADEYEQYLNDSAAAQLTSNEGVLGIQILRRPTPEAVEFIVVTYWKSNDAIQNTIGANMEQAIPLPRDPEFLIEPVTTVKIYEVVYSRYQ